MILSDRIVVMEAGRIEQVGSPFEIYNRPATAHVAGFIGTLNLLAATPDRQDRQLVHIGGQAIRCAQVLPDQAGAAIQPASAPAAALKAARRKKPAGTSS